MTDTTATATTDGAVAVGTPATPLLHDMAVALVTPFLEDDSGVNTAAVAPLVEMHLAAGTAGFYLCGSTGEGAAMTVPERKAMVEAAVAAVAGRAPVVVMVGNCSQEDAIELAKHAEAAGADAVSTTVPKDKPRDLDAAVEFFTAVGSASSLPLYIYWIAATAAGGMTARKFLESVKGVPHLAGIKFTDTNFFLFQQLLALGPEVLGRPFNCVTGPDEMAVAGLAMGAHGAIGSTYNVQPKLNAAMHAAFRSGDVARATALQWKCNAMIALFFEHCELHISGFRIVAGIKALLRARGFAVGRARAATGRIPEESEASLLAAAAALAWAVE